MIPPHPELVKSFLKVIDNDSKVKEEKNKIIYIASICALWFVIIILLITMMMVKVEYLKSFFAFYVFKL